MDLKTYIAVGELVQAAAHQHGLTGPVQWTVCPVRNFSKSGGEIDRSKAEKPCRDHDQRSAADRRHRYGHERPGLGQQPA